MTAPAPDRTFVRQYSNDEVLGLSLNVGGTPADPEDSSVVAVMTNDETNAVVLDTIADRVGIGRYQVTLDGTTTDTIGNFTLTFYYRINGNDERYAIYIEIGSGVDAYDNIPFEFQQLIDNVRVKFADLFDSPNGGPHLQVYFQTHWTPARYAQLLRSALGTLNTGSQPVTSYTLDGVDGPLFPLQKWGALLEKSLYIEVIRHLRRSYVEQPMLVGGEVTRHDRRDYFDRWGIILEEEMRTFEKQVEAFKISHAFSSGPKILVSGGAYGIYGPTRLPLSAAARPRFYGQYY